MKLNPKVLLKGTPASVGIANGKVKIIVGSEDFPEMKGGEVLVTVMTNPLFVPLMRKAAAIVTDVGGQLSHAAIVSRELGIPCVTGTKNATRVLKNGIEVIVDGKRGRVLKKNESILKPNKKTESRKIS